METKMYTVNDIAVVIPSYNNLEYLKLIYDSVRKISSEIELHIFDDGSTDGTRQWLVSLKDPNVNKGLIDVRVGHTILYDIGFKDSTKPIIGILHSDMVVHMDFFDNILKHIAPNVIVSGTCIEPPLHTHGGEKYIFNAGMYPDDFNNTLFNAFCGDAIAAIPYNIPGGVKSGIFAPWFIFKDEYFDKIGGHDPIYAPYGYEDSDIFARMALAGFEFIQSRDALVYHFTQRGHKWSKGIGIENDGYRAQMEKTRRLYVTKFGTDPIFDYDRRPTPAPKYDIGLIIHNASPALLHFLEPYYAIISDKGPLKNDIVVEVDAKHIGNQIPFLLRLPLIIKESGQIGEMEWDIFKISIKSLNEYQNELIKLKI